MNCTLGELEQRMSHAEYVVWVAEERIRVSEVQAAQSQASKGMRPRRSRRR